MLGRTRVVTSLTPGSRLLVSDLVLPQFTEADCVARAGAGQPGCCAGGNSGRYGRSSRARPLGLGPRQHKHRRCAGASMTRLRAWLDRRRAGRCSHYRHPAARTGRPPGCPRRHGPAASPRCALQRSYRRSRTAFGTRVGSRGRLAPGNAQSDPGAGTLTAPRDGVPSRCRHSQHRRWQVALAGRVAWRVTARRAPAEPGRPPPTGPSCADGQRPVAAATGPRATGQRSWTFDPQGIARSEQG